MNNLKKNLTQVITQIDDKVDAFTSGFRQRFGLNEPLQIITYRSYGTPHRLYIKGRVLEDKSIKKSSKEDSIFQNLLAMYKRFESDEVSGATLTVCHQNKVHEVITDKEGYFVLNLTPAVPVSSDSLWHEVDITLMNAPVPFDTPLSGKAQVLVPPADAEYGIISDLDDTIIRTDVRDLVAMSRNVFLKNAFTRLPFAGVSEFYRSLQLGTNGKRNNPFFYLSSSPWNLYDLLIDFLDHNQIPEGSLLLRDLSWRENKLFNSGHMGHKFKEIEQILTTYPLLKFILIGDSGQEDPKIYHEVVKKYPGRILAVYIRDVQISDREKIAIEISKLMSQDQVEMVIVDTTLEAAEHAASMGWILRETLPGIHHDQKLDKGEISGKESIQTPESK